jgi:DNA-directed RNA polymerase subunit beta
VPFDAERLKGFKASVDLIDADIPARWCSKPARSSPPAPRVSSPRRALKALLMSTTRNSSATTSPRISSTNTGEIYAEAGDEITEKSIKSADESAYTDLPLLDIDHVNVGPYIRNTLADKNS